MKNIIFCASLVASLMIVAAKADAQVDGSTYKSAVGIRLSGGYYDLISASLKTFITQQGALEFNLGGHGDEGFGYRWFVLSASGSYQHHFDIPAVEGLKWFIGGGLTIFNSFSKDDNRDGFGLAIFPTGGADYKFAGIPLDVSVDFRPTIGIVNPYDNEVRAPKPYSGFYVGNFGASARYTFR
jgi:opacity protein-like surface antigen